jgi:hypothetical protein
MTNKMSTEALALLIWAQSYDLGDLAEYLGVEMSIVRAVLFVPIPSTRANKTPTRADERRERGKARCCLLGLLET